MKSLKKLAGMIGIVILLCGIMTGCSGKRLYSEEELTQIHDVVGGTDNKGIPVCDRRQHTVAFGGFFKQGRFDGLCVHKEI